MNIPIPGTESEKGVVSALDDLFGPSFREVGEYLADKVRFHRYRAAKKIIERARAISGKKELEAPPVKFLVPFFESSSLEDEESSLIDMWAKLLVDASTDFGSKHIIFMRLLKEMSGQEAALLKALAEDYRGDRDIHNLNTDIEMAEYEISDSYLGKFLHDNVGQVPDSEISGLIIDRFDSAGVYIDVVHVSTGQKYIWPHHEVEGDQISGVISPLSQKYGFSFEVLRSLGIIRKFVSSELWHQHISLEVHAWVVTDLGAQLYMTCDSR